MPGKPEVVTTRPLVRGSVLPRREPRRPLLARLARRPQPAPAGAPRLLVLVPAHDAAGTLARTLTSLRAQTRPADRVVVLADACTDDTEQVARRFPGTTVLRTVENTDGRTGALAQGWRRFQGGADLVAVVDADTVLAPDCLEQLERELDAGGRHGGVLVRFGVDQQLGSTPLARVLLHRDPAEHTAWAMDALQGGRSEHARGGHVVLAGAQALRDVAAARGTAAPWYAAAPDPDQQLLRDLRRAGHVAGTSTAARVHAGPVLTVAALARRRARPQRFGARLAGAVALRVALLAALVATLAGALPVWPWAVAAGLAVVAGAVRALRRPHRSPADVVAGALLVPGEVDLWLRVGCAARARSAA
ncbi:Glycosyl transferase family 2 [Klenkia marina]|uniref:4,4'-diaponeurosporenoate glycosyltransferase n=1 Tax=Klenkia marina TaxID=1960309 RepID=A0A1G4XZ67_9ACTN|nr:glycosyltransferase family 2 protein [Klenkia marina]SCX45928.1 Glycosyl transferase family 2 [Klenkia marina]